MHKAYCQCMRQHIQSLTMQLKQLTEIDLPLNQFKSMAAERLIQVLIEACIVLAKHWVKHKGVGGSDRCQSCFYLICAAW